MEIINDRLTYSATDLVGFLECGHLVSLERAAVSGHLERPMHSDPVLDRIAQRGQVHEERFLGSLLSDGFHVVNLELDPDLPRGQRVVKARDATLAAMRKLIVGGLISKNERVVLLVTGNAHKYLDMLPAGMGSA